MGDRMNIMLIEDDLEMQELLHDYLQNFDLHVSSFEDPLLALDTLKNKDDFALVVLDLMLPKLDGFDVCKKIREISSIPIIISSARGNLGDKVVAFEYGADDYLAKPYEPKELVMRINAILRRLKKTYNKKQIGSFVIDEDKMLIFQDEEELPLTKIEYEIFSLLLNNQNKVLSRENIANHIGIDYTNLKDRTIDMHMSNIRTKIFDDSKSPKYIKSVWGIGYKFIG
jgi:two-component system OmpR family response regulator